MKSLDSKYLNQLTINATDIDQIHQISRFQGRQEMFFKQIPEVLESLTNIAKVESTESSNAIENIVVPRKDIEDIVLRDNQPKNRSEQEIVGYKDALTLIHDVSLSRGSELIRDMPFTINTIKQIHQMIYRYHSPDQGGRWKMTSNEIVQRDEHGNVTKVLFKPVQPIETDQAMRDLTNHFNREVRSNELNALVLIPLTILDFLCIHPFSDGNGRTSRLLTTLLLYYYDYQVGRYISLERIIEQSKESYYEALRASDRGWHQQKHDVKPWLRYFWGVLVRAYSEFEERLGTLKGKHGDKTEMVKNAIQRKVGPFSVSDIERDCPGISTRWIRDILREMKNSGKIKLLSMGRSAKYVIVESG